MAGKNPGFNAKAFRKNIRFVYQMAAPPLTEEQASFYFPTQLVYNVGTDAEDTPFDPSSTVVRTQPDPIKVPCSIEFKETSGQVIDFGVLTPALCIVTLLDEDYERIKGCSYMVLRGEKYNYESTDAPSGLFDVGLYSLQFRAESST